MMGEGCSGAGKQKQALCCRAGDEIGEDLEERRDRFCTCSYGFPGWSDLWVPRESAVSPPVCQPGIVTN